MRAAVLSVSALCLLLLPLSSLAEFPLPTGDGAGSELTVPVASVPWRIAQIPTGHRIEMEGYGLRLVPGAPRLPEKTLMLLLPPGARATGVEVLSSTTSELPGSYALESVGDLLPLSGPRARTGSIDPGVDYPAKPARIVAAGFLGQYSYVAVSYCPFTYNAESGRLVHREDAVLQLSYAVQPTQLHFDAKHMDRAEELFDNFSRFAPEYANPGGEEPREETADMLILTTAALRNSVEASGFIAWKNSLGISVEVMIDSDPAITGQSGVDEAERIRNFLMQNYQQIDLSYLLIVGSVADIPMRYCFPQTDDHSHNPSNPSNCGASVPTDHYYADLSLPDTESWDLDGDGYHGEYGDDAPDFVAEISVGRVPVSVPSRVTYTLDKFVRFEQDDGDWKDRALHGGAILFHEGQDGWDIPFRDGAVCLDLIEQDCMEGWPVSHLCEHEGLVPSEYPWGALSEDFFTGLWRGSSFGIVNWTGHGSPDAVWRLIWTWDDGDGVYETDGSDGRDWSAFTNLGSDLDDDHPGYVFAVSCKVGYPEANSTGNLGIDLLTDPGLGSGAGVLSATRNAHVSAYWPEVYGGAESICCEFNHSLLADNLRLGDALHDAIARVHVECHWDSYGEYKTLFDYNLYGDPSQARKGAATAVASNSPFAASAAMSSYPNPFRSSTRLSFAATGESAVALEIFDVRGRRVAELSTDLRAAGGGSLLWDGRDGSGNELPSGVYLARLRTERGEATHRLMLLR